MPTLETYKKQAKLLVRWHREGNYSIGGRIRQLPRYQALTDHEALTLKFPLSEAQEIIALEAGYHSWAELKTATATATPARSGYAEPATVLKRTIPVLFVRDVSTAAEFYRGRLGFTVNFLHGHPPFYGSVSRDGAALHLKFVHEAVYTAGASQREGLIMAFIDVKNVRRLYAEYKDAAVEFAQKLTKEAWGGTAFVVRDPDGNSICFAG